MTDILRDPGCQEGNRAVVYAPTWTSDTPDIDREQIQQAVAASLAAMQRASETYAAEMAPVFAAMQDTIRHLPPIGPAVRDESPTDPMERALWLRRNRNTGPAVGRLDGRRRRR